MERETIITLERMVAIHAGKPGELLMLAEELMDHFGTIPEAAPALMQQLGLTAGEIQSILSFYHYPVSNTPVRCRVEVCGALSCHLKNSADLLHALCETFSAEPGVIKADSRLLISRSECLSHCDHAPTVSVNGENCAGADLPGLIARIREALS